MTVPLYRGVGVPFELTVMKTPNNCSGHLRVYLSWDKAENWVKVHVVGKGALTPHPSITRTEGVDYFPNPFWPEQKDIVNGRYQFWLISPARELVFYYDPMTLQLLGSEKDFATPPAAIPVLLPTLVGVGSAFFQPDADGDVDFTWTFRYDRMTRGDNPKWGPHWTTFPPTNLCESNPFRYDQTTSRPYITPPQDPSTSRTFGEWLKSGLIFDTTVEPAHYYTNPPLTTMVATYSNATLFGGAVPKGWIMDFDQIFGNLSPAIKPWVDRDKCENWYRPQHLPNINFCTAPGGAQ